MTNDNQPLHCYWKRVPRGYEVSTAGDRRFSAFNAKLPDGRSIEETYQCDIKGYQPGGTNWRLGKNKPPLDTTIDLWGKYLELWRTWAENNPDMMAELLHLAYVSDGRLSDCFARTPVNQARALAVLLNEWQAANRIKLDRSIDDFKF